MSTMLRFKPLLAHSTPSAQVSSGSDDSNARWWSGAMACILAIAMAGCGGGGSGESGSTPSTPASLQPPADITADAGKQRVTLNWSNVAQAASFTIYYANAPGISKSSSRITDAHSIYVMRDLPNGVPVYLAVATVGAQGHEGSLSREVSATPSPTPPQPAPVTLQATALNGQVQVSWQPGFSATADPTSYAVYYGTRAALDRATSAKVLAVASPVTVAGLVNGSEYHFAVTAITTNGESSLSYLIAAMPQVMPPPAAPLGLTAEDGDAHVTLRWSPSAGASSYTIYHGTEFGVNRLNGTAVSAASSPFVLATLTNRSAYYFVVSAVGPGGEGFSSAQVSATPLAARPLPAMLPIPGGSFLMGDNQVNPAAIASYALPVHMVSVNAFSMDQYETTYAQWRLVQDWALGRGYDFDLSGRNGALELGTNMPVTQVSWYDVVKWLNARSEMEGRNPVYFTDATQTTVYRSGMMDLTSAAVAWSANGYRLPTEAEWEWAARGGLVGQLYPWGNVLDPSRANYDRGTSTSVGIYPPNGYGLYDMAGNVWEWTWDRVRADYSLDAGGVSNPHGPDTGITRVRRGGSYVYGERYLRNFDKMFREPTYNGPYFGFRSASSQP